MLRITLLGSMHLCHDGSATEVKLTRITQALLGYLLLQRHRTHPRDVLADLFWEECSQEQARSCLSTALWRLRQALDSHTARQGAYLVTTPTGEIGFDARGDVWLDIAQLEAAVMHAQAQPSGTLDPAEAAGLAQALQLYTGDLLEGCYDEWTIAERERLRCLYVDGLRHLMEYHRSRREYEEGLIRGRQILALDPLREEIHRAMMRLYLDNGQRAAALRQYESCRESLARELGIPPMPETQAVYASIAPGGHAESAVRAAPSATLAQALQQLQVAMARFDEAHSSMRQAAQLVQNLAERALQ